MSKVLAKFKVAEVTEAENYYRGQEPVKFHDGKVGGHSGGATLKRIKLNAVMGEPFGPATPSGTIEMVIVNQAAAEHFHVGKEYFVTFKEDTGEGAD